MLRRGGGCGLSRRQGDRNDVKRVGIPVPVVLWRGAFDTERKGQEIGDGECREVLAGGGLLCYMRINARRTVVGTDTILEKGPKATSGEAFVGEGWICHTVYAWIH